MDLNRFERALEALALECNITDHQMFNLIAMNQACITEEREACAQIADGFADCNVIGADSIAECIRARK